MRKANTKAVRGKGKLQDLQLTIGLDLGDRSSFYCVLNGAGEVILEERVATSPEAMKKTFGTHTKCWWVWKDSNLQCSEERRVYGPVGRTSRPNTPSTWRRGRESNAQVPKARPASNGIGLPLAEPLLQ